MLQQVEGAQNSRKTSAGKLRFGNIFEANATDPKLKTKNREMFYHIIFMIALNIQNTNRYLVDPVAKFLLCFSLFFFFLSQTHKWKNATQIKSFLCLKVPSIYILYILS